MRNFIAAFSLTLLLAACSDDTPTPTPASGPADVTTIVYMMADNSLSAFADRDIAEMEAAAAQVPLASRFVVYLDNGSPAQIFTIDRQQGRSLHAQLAAENACDTLTMERNLRRIIADFPASHYRLVLWSHGSGWTPAAPQRAPRRTIGQDAPTQTYVELPALARLLGRLPTSFDFIFFDACFMQGVEVDYELRHAARYIVASPAEIPGNGAPYHRIMTALTQREADPELLAQTYYDYYTDGSGLVISVCRTSQLDTLRTVTRRLAPDLYTSTQPTANVQYYCSWRYTETSFPEFFDMGSALAVRLPEAAYRSWRRVADTAYPLQLHTPTWLSNYSPGLVTDTAHTAAVSLFLPNAKYDVAHLNERVHDYAWAW